MSRFTLVSASGEVLPYARALTKDVLALSDTCTHYTQAKLSPKDASDPFSLI